MRRTGKSVYIILLRDFYVIRELFRLIAINLQFLPFFLFFSNTADETTQAP